jgi:hypothetical protein
MAPPSPGSSAMNPPTPYGSTPSAEAMWKARGGLVKMVGFVIEGVGILVTGLGIHYFLELVNGNGSSNIQSIYNNLFNTLEAGVIVAGIGVIVIGIGVYVSSRQS